MIAAVLVRHGSAARAFEMRELPDPELKPEEVRIRVEMSGINFADVMARLGIYPDAPKPPAVLGYEVVGIISETGSAVRNFQPGQKVLAFTRFGGYASSVVTRAVAVVPIPDSMDSGAATALATQYSTAYYMAEEMVRLHPGDQVLIHAAAGGVGTALVQLARRRKCVIHGTAGGLGKLEYLKRLGVDFVTDYREQDFAREFLKNSGSRRPDVIFDSIGGSVTRRGLKLLGSGGRMVSYGVAGMAGGKAKLLKSVQVALSFGLPHPIWLLSNAKSFIGVNMLRIADDRPEILNRCMRDLLELAVKGEIKPLVGKVFPVDRIEEAHRFVESRLSTGKVVLRWPPR